MSESDSKQNVVVSLEEMRKRHNQQVTASSLPPEQKIRILQEDVEKLVRIVLDQEQRIESLEDRVWKAIRLARQIQEATGVKSSPLR